MSGVKRSMEQQQHNESIVNAVKALMERDYLDGAALGVAKKIAAEGKISELSDKQYKVFEDHIVNRVCEGSECGRKIPVEELADAILQDIGDGVLCEECRHTEYRLSSHRDED